MPCYDYRGDEARIVYQNGVDPEPYRRTIDEILNTNSKLEASLCALITELEKRGLATEILPQASRSGLIDLMSFWKEHSKEDEARLSNLFHKFSEHEQDMIKKLIKEGKL